MERDQQQKNASKDSANEISKTEAEQESEAEGEKKLINSKNQNIDTMKETKKDSEMINMDHKDNQGKHMEKEQEKDSNKPVGKRVSELSKKAVTSVQKAWNSYINISGGNFIYPVFFIIGSILYLEIILHFLNYRSIDIKIIYPILFGIPFGLLLSIIAGLFSQRVNKILLWLFTGCICIIFITQLIYFYVFKVYFSFQSLGLAQDAFSEFGTDILSAMKANIGGIILLLLPLILLGLLIHNQIDYRRRGLKEQAILLGSSVTFQLIALIALLIFGKSDYTPYDLYYNTKVADLCGKQLGITTMTWFDIGGIFNEENELILDDTIATNTKPGVVPTKAPTPVPKKEPSVTEEQKENEPTKAPTPTPIDTSPNVMDIDFNALAEKESNDTIKTLHEYFASAAPTNKNQYTGMFKGYNLIMITAEGFSPYAINEQKTPTLYKLVREGFVFKNFYTALWQTSTSDGEYVAMTGLIPIGTRSMYHGRKNLWPFSLGEQFNRLGIESKAYHNHTYTYYQRNETHTNLGYIFKGKGNGLELENPDIWPESDLELIDATVDEYVGEDQFHVYYLTVSGHMNYTFTGNSMSYKNRNLVTDLPYSDDAKAYIACQMELDKALEQLIAKLEEAGVADRTVIALSADHYPYGWEKYKLDELAGHEIDPDFEIFRNHFILWSKGMKENIIIERPCSSLDILPTLSNLFGLEYDSRLLMGQDILSDAEPLVVLSNRSYITDKVMYNSETGEVIKLTEEELPEGYIDNLNSLVKNKFSVSKSILKEDYYRYVFPNNQD